MENINFKKSDNVIWFTKIYGENPNYLCDISYIQGNKKGSSKSITLKSIAIKLHKEHFIIQNDITSAEKIDIWQKLWCLIK